MPGKFKVKIVIVIIIILTSAILIIIIPGLSINIPFIYNTKSSSTEIILKEINKLSTLSTVEYIYKSVFPFDFLDQEQNGENYYQKEQKVIS